MTPPALIGLLPAYERVEGVVLEKSVALHSPCISIKLHFGFRWVTQVRHSKAVLLSTLQTAVSIRNRERPPLPQLFDTTTPCPTTSWVSVFLCSRIDSVSTL